MPGYLRPHVQTIFPGPQDPKYKPDPDPQGQQGSYWVEFAFFPQPLIHSDIEEQILRSGFIGDSHLQISDPLPSGADRKHVFSVLASNGEITYFIYCNVHGRLSHVNFRSPADSFDHAIELAKAHFEPFLSGWSARFNVPLYVFRIRALEEATNVVRNVVYHQLYPVFRVSLNDMNREYWFPSDLRVLDFYREGLNATAPKYQFLCYYKVIDLVLALRTTRASEAHKQGDAPARYRDILLREEWFMAHLPPQLQGTVVGMKFTAIRDTVLRPLRNKIAHALVEDDDGSRLADDEVYPYLPVAKLMAERLLTSECREQQTGAPMANPTVERTR